MRFEVLSWIYSLWLIPVLTGLIIWGYHARKRALAKVAEQSLLFKLAPRMSLARVVVKDVFLVVAIAFVILALMRPQWGFHWEDMRREGVDIVVAVDVSDSMLAEDVSPNRLQRAKRKIADLLRILDGDRVGLVAFSGAAYLQSPLTLDYGTTEMFLDYLDVDLIPVKGTSIGSAIEVALDAFQVAQSNARAILLITDGEDLGQQAIPMAEEAKKQGVRIYSIGIGSEKGAPIPNKMGGDFRKNLQGEMVFSKLNAEALGKLAEITGGYFVRSVSDDDDLIKIYRDEIRKDIAAQELKSSRVKRYEERFQWPLALAGFFLLTEFFMSARRRKPWQAAATSLLLLLLCSVAFLRPVPAEAASFSEAFSLFSSRYKGEMAYKDGNYAEAIRHFEDALVEDPENAEIKMNLASAYYKSGDYKKAEEAWRTSLKDAEKIKEAERRKAFEERAHYDLGNAAFRQGKLPEAADGYRKALGIDPKDEDAAHNLKIVEEEIKKQKQQQEQKDQKKNDEKDQKKEQQPQGQKDQNAEKQKDQDKGKEKEAGAGPTPTPAAAATAQPAARGTEQAPAAKLSKEEAERLLNSLTEDQKNAIRKKIEEQTQGRKAEGGNDW